MLALNSDERIIYSYLDTIYQNYARKNKNLLNLAMFLMIIVIVIVLLIDGYIFTIQMHTLQSGQMQNPPLLKWLMNPYISFIANEQLWKIASIIVILLYIGNLVSTINFNTDFGLAFANEVYIKAKNKFLTARLSRVYLYIVILKIALTLTALTYTIFNTWPYAKAFHDNSWNIDVFKTTVDFLSDGGWRSRYLVIEPLSLIICIGIYKIIIAIFNSYENLNIRISTITFIAVAMAYDYYIWNAVYNILDKFIDIRRYTLPIAGVLVIISLLVIYQYLRIEKSVLKDYAVNGNADNASHFS